MRAQHLGSQNLTPSWKASSKNCGVPIYDNVAASSLHSLCDYSVYQLTYQLYKQNISKTVEKINWYRK